ncbi:HAD-IIA family hydrolase [Flaviflexus huanghaiensis]|uniref:HAD-IIA family hydrolase n=1 Tax=Flaviflexus huanghaiensis TaxID=1111473 RepID=UPI0015FCF27F|nr:HAD-IIA family hydrolase [Flaviflexus huanghaiensis]
MKSSATPLSEAYDVSIYDLDGVCYRGNEPVAGAAESIVEARGRGQLAVYLTNNAARTPHAIGEHLRSLNIPAEDSEVYTAAMAAAELAAEEIPAGSKVFVIGGEGLVEALTDKGFTPVNSADEDPAAVVQGFHPSVGWELMSEGALAINRGAVFIASNLDATLPQERGFMLGNGALVKAVEHATGVVPLATGKPLPKVFEQAALSASATRPLAVGDRLNTDIRGAVAAGVDSLHVLTGVSDERDVALAVPEERPTYLAKTLVGLNETHEAPAFEGRRAVLGDEWAEVTGGVLTASHPLSDASLDLYRCVVAACWAAADAGTSRDALSDQITDLVVV